jgi:oligopeptidase B
LLDGDDPFGAVDLVDRAFLVRGDDDPSTTMLAENLEHDLTHVRIVMTSLVTPRTAYDVELATGALTWRKTQIVRGNFEASRYVTGRLWVPASDGTLIPVSVVARKDLVTVQADGSLIANETAPLLLYGYGSYEISMDPAFSALRLSLLDRGIIYAVAHIRGGGELGRRWYLNGKLALKPTTFSDFVAVARHLVALEWTTPEQLAAYGGSAGGLLMGAVMNLAPDLFKAVLAAVPFVDALTTMLDVSLPLTMNEWEEWGNPLTDADAYRTMKGYSPYDNVRSTNDDGTPRVYPHLLAIGGLNDSRVGFWEPAKWVQRLRDANPANVAYLKTDLTSGHGGPSGRYDAWRDDAKEYAFIVSEITRR